MKTLWSGIKAVFSALQAFGAVSLGIFTLLLLVFAFTAGGPELPVVKDGTVLVVRPTGMLVERPERHDPVQAFIRREIDRSAAPTSNFHDLMIALERARTDDRIVAVQLDTSFLTGASIAQQHEIAAKLGEMRTSGKPIYAVSGAYSQSQYLMAAEATTLYMNDYGSAFLTGYGLYPTYYAQVFERLGITINVFRVGTYKAFVEPYTLTAMSDAAKSANRALLGDLWSAYLASVGNARGVAPEEIQLTLDEFDTAFSQSGGDFADFALSSGWIDTKSSGRSWRKDIAASHGNGKTYTSMSYLNYLRATDAPVYAAEKEIAVIVVEGTIAPGQNRPGIAGAASILADIRAARKNPATKAIVLRVDSPGGSQYASELIRQELENAQADGVPVIASMGGAAASGGYWISATADEIWAAPTTITGSIGIFAMIPTYEGSAQKVGVTTDGVGTTALAGGISLLNGISPQIASILQSNINRGYEDFLSLVARGRNMDVNAVDAIAQGRAWSGSRAKALGLVDQLGSFEHAVRAAARAAKLDGAYTLNFYQDPLSPFDQVLDGLLGVRANSADAPDAVLAPVNPTRAALLRQLDQLTSVFDTYSDPAHAYLLCLACEVE